MIQHSIPIPVENLTLMQLVAHLQVAHEELRGRLENNEARAGDIDQRLAVAERRLADHVAQLAYLSALADQRLSIIGDMYYAFLEFEHASPEARRAMTRARAALEEVG